RGPLWRGEPGRLSRAEFERGQRRLFALAGLAARLAAEAEALEAIDLAFTLDARRVLGGQARDQVGDAVAQLQSEVRRRGSHQAAHVLDRDLAPALGAPQPLGLLCLAHGRAGGGGVIRRLREGLLRAM